jgi:hypothetical protein
MDEARSRNMISSQSFKFGGVGRFVAINAGTYDADIDAWAARCIARAPWPIWLCYFHEPEDDMTVKNADGSTNVTATRERERQYRLATRRMVLRFRARGVKNVAWMPIYMNPYTFQSGSGRDWRNYNADWTGTGWHDDLTMDMMGMDTYDPLPWAVKDSAGRFLPPPEGPWPTARRNHYTFPGLWSNAFAKMEQAGYPVWDYVIPEFGMSNGVDPDPDWGPWGATARDFAKAHRIKAFCYWDNSGDIGRYSFDTRLTSVSGSPYTNAHPDANGTKKIGWNNIVNGAKVWRTPSGAGPIG